MNATFYHADNFNQNISNWDVSNVTVNTNFSFNSPIDGTSKSPF